MTTDEPEEAVIAPAARAGVAVEPGLVAELVTDTTTQPGALPLLQFTLTELFDRSDDAMPHPRASTARRRPARDPLPTRERPVVGLGEVGNGGCQAGTPAAGAPGTWDDRLQAEATSAELADLDVDPVALSEVLDTFGRRHRLLSFDRDPVTGECHRRGCPRGAASRVGAPRRMDRSLPRSPSSPRHLHRGG